MSDIFSRRQVLRGSGLAVATTLLSRFPAGASSLPVLGEYDVVVVGSGASGMTAALTAAKRGLSCVVVEKAPTFGGSAARVRRRDLDSQQPGHPRRRRARHLRQGRAVPGRRCR
ncbi:hypothetical protein GCM10018954_023980 [Kutzneria kofuensis]